MSSSSSSISVLIVGCGSRGENYAAYALHHASRAQVVGLADPRVHARNKLAKLHEKTVQKDKVFSDWRDILRFESKLADCVVIALPDKLHKEAAVELTKKGYHMLLEKPMATLLDDCKEITMCSRANPSQINAVCHVLRYYPPVLKLKQLIDSGIIGNIVNINHTEPVGFYHFAHSFVRGNWHNTDESSFSLLAKCCHDIDLIVHWMQGKKCTKVSSFGSLQHFRKENAPLNSTIHCLTCPNESKCCYSAKKIYLDSMRAASSWPCSVVLSSEIQNVVADEPVDDIENFFTSKSESEKRELLRKCLEHEKTNYGRCVYAMDNDVCDNQVVSMQFDDQSTATLTMIAFTHQVCARKTSIYGTKGQLEWDDASPLQKIVHYDFLTRETNHVDYSNAVPIDLEVDREFLKVSGHGGADYWLMHTFIEAIKRNDKSFILTDVEDSFRSHLIVFAAEYSRLNEKIVDVEEFCRINDISFN